MMQNSPIRPVRPSCMHSSSRGSIRHLLSERERRIDFSVSMPRPKLQREPCDCLDCREPPSGASAAAATTAAAVARQEPPPKSLVLCLWGAVQLASSLQEAYLPHLDAVVLGGWSGLLACRAGGPPLAHQLLGILQAGSPPPTGLLPDRFKHLRAVLLTDSPDVAQAGVLAGCHAVHQLGASSKSSDAGCAWRSQSPRQLASHIAKLLRVRPMLPTGTAAPARVETAPALAAVLAAGAAGSAQPEDSVQEKQAELEQEEDEGEIEMLILALDAQHAQPPSAPTRPEAAPADGPEAEGSAAGQEKAGRASSSTSSSSWALEWLDSLVRHLGGVQGFRDTVLLSLVLMPGPEQQAPGKQLLLPVQQPVLAPRQPTQPTAAAAAEGGGNRWERAAAGARGGGGGRVVAQRSVAAAAGNGGVVDFPAVRRPIQSYQVAGLEQVAVDEQRPALVVHRLPGVIRVDEAAALDVQEIVERGAAGCILAERLLPEVAYKLGRAPKYGA